VPADLIVLKYSEAGNVFIKTDQLDGETDWKLRKPHELTFDIEENALLTEDIRFEANAPNLKIYDFKGSVEDTRTSEEKGLSLDNTAWANTVMAS
jgi:phospholipid-translocating ATPase